MRNLTDKDFLYCYDIKLTNHFKEHGLTYIIKAKSIKDNKIFTLWEKSDELYSVMKQYKSN